MSMKGFEVEEERPVLASDRDWKNPMWHKAPFVLVNELCERLCYYGMSTNLSMYLKKQMGYGTSEAASMMQIWQGTCYLSPLIGAYIADAHLGRFKVIAGFSSIYLIGMLMLVATTFLPGIKPPGDGSPANGLQQGTFWAAMYIIALGTGGIKPNVSSFGADQFNPDDPREAKLIPTFFNLFYMSINIGSLFASTVLVYIQEQVSWTIGFLIPAIAMALAIIVFFSASARYIKKPPAGNPYAEMFKIIGVALSKQKTPLPEDPDELYEVEDAEYMKKQIHRMPHTAGQKWLDHACIQGPGITKVKTVTAVEEIKTLGRLMPIAIIAIAYQTLYAQMFSLFVLQGDCMNKQVGKFTISAAMMSTWDIIAILIGMPLYDAFLVPVLKKYCGWNTLRRIGTGYAAAAIAIAMGAIVEIVRLKQVNSLGMQELDPSTDPPPLSIWWQTPQYIIIGISEIFAMSGMYEFFYAQAPDSLISFSMALQLLTVAAGSYLSSFLVYVIGLITCCPGWLPPVGYTLNQGRLDLFFWLLFVMQIFALGLHIGAGKLYKSKQVIEWPVVGGGDGAGEADDEFMVDTMPSKYSFAVGSEVASLRRRMDHSMSGIKYSAVDKEEMTPMV